jgi:hypothetical protein
MIGVIWNCRGCQRKGWGLILKKILSEVNADFIGLQETMKKKYLDKFLEL